MCDKPENNGLIPKSHLREMDTLGTLSAIYFQVYPSHLHKIYTGRKFYHLNIRPYAKRGKYMYKTELGDHFWEYICYS